MFLKKGKLRSSEDSDKVAAASSPLLLQLPVELLRIVVAYLPPDGRVALALACHALLSVVGTDVFKELSPMPPTFQYRSAESYLLRALQRDRNDPSIYVCYRCLKFHVLSDPDPPLSRLALLGNSISDIGFPACQTPYMDAMRVVTAMLDTPREELQPQSWSGSIKSPVDMQYEAETGFGTHDLFLMRKFKLKAKANRFSKYFMVPSSFLLTANLEICPHVFFGGDCRKDPGTMYHALDKYYHRQYRDWHLAISRGQTWQPEPFTGFICQECRLEIDIRFRALEVRITVWNHMGVLKKKPVAWPERVVQNIREHRSFERKLAKKGYLEAGDLEEEWENIHHKNKGAAYDSE